MTGITNAANAAGIREVVEEGLNRQSLGQYTRHAAPIVSALEDRESAIADSLIEFATENGMSRDAAVSAMRNVGLTMKVGSTTGMADPRLEAIEAQLAQMQQTLRNLRG